MSEQRNPYKGSPPRPWIRVALVAPDGTTRDLQVLADTGSPFALVVSSSTLQQFLSIGVPGVSSNFGDLEGGWVRLQIPDAGIDADVLAYGSDNVVQAVESSHPDFAGLAGLPLLRMTEYGGDRDDFWIRGQP
jgi:hypothetical protein